MPFFCSICGFEVANKRGLASHFRHQSETHPPYKEYQENLKWEGKVEGVDYVKCLECGHRSHSLARHIKSAHGITGDQYRAKHGEHVLILSISAAKSRNKAIKVARQSSAYGGEKEVLCVDCGKPYLVHKLAQATKCSTCKDIESNKRWVGKKENEDYVVCLDCGYKAENLTSHIMSEHPTYRERYPNALVVALNSSMRDKTHLIGQKRSLETRQKMSENAGRWNKGLTKEDHPSIKAISISRMGCVSWNKGLTKEDDERLQKTSENLKQWYQDNDRHWESPLKKNFVVTDFVPFLEKDGSVDHVRAMEGLGVCFPTLKKYTTELGLDFTNKYMEARFKRQVISLPKSTFDPFLTNTGRVHTHRAKKVLGYSWKVLRREMKKHGLEHHRALIKQSLCLDAVSEALGGADYLEEWQHKNFTNPETGYRYRYDGYFKELGLVVEFHGHQHYEFPNAFHKTEEKYKAMVERDKQKQAYIDNTSHLVYFCVRADEPYDDVAYLKGRLFQLGFDI